ncbi:hypothetical protein [Ruminococcus sp.]|uniref:hypothetical protein n=1 Tax=Ruminococcus sp. TaxID=41978 RepID=UPI003EFE5D76
MINNKRTYNLVMEDLINYLRTTKGDYETYALYVAIRMFYTNSKVFNPSPYRIMELCNVGYTKACRLLAKAKNDKTNHFHVAKRDKGLVALSNKGLRIKQDKRGREYKSDFCHKISKGEYTLGQIVKILKRAMLSHFIDCVTCERTNRGASSGVQNDVKAVRKMIPQEFMQRFCYLTRSSMNRLVLELASVGVFEKSDKTLVKVIDHVNNTTAAEYKGAKFFVWEQAQSGWVCLTCSYLMNECAKSSFRHIFWRKRHNHPRLAKKPVRNEKKKVFVGDIDVELYFATQHD